MGASGLYKYISACAGIPLLAPVAWAEVRLRPAHEVSVQAFPGSGTIDVIEGGGSRELGKNTFYSLRSPGRVPMILAIVEGSTPQDIELNAPRLEEWPPEQTQQKLNRGYSELLESSYKINRLLEKNNPSEALTELTRLEAQYPGVTYLGFLKASAYLLLGRRQEASDSLSKALAAHPQDPRGLELKAALDKLNDTASEGKSP